MNSPPANHPDDVPKNQHFVAQMHLRRFANPNTRGRAISVFDLDRSVTIPRASIRGQCAHPFLYGADGAVERMLADIEGKTSIAFEKITKDPDVLKRSLDVAKTILIFAALQYGRTPAARRETQSQTDRFFEQAIKTAPAGVTPHDAAEGLKLVGLGKSVSQTAVLGMMFRLAGTLADLDAIVIRNDTPIEFVLSDIGVSFHNQWTDGATEPGGSGTGLASSGLLIFLPIDKRHLLIKYDPSIYQVRGAVAGLLVTSAPSDIKALNHVQMAFAERHVYFSGDLATERALFSLRRHCVRAPRATQVRAQRLKETAGTRELVMTYWVRPKLGFQVPWLCIRSKPARLPMHQRARRLRPFAMAYFDSVRDKTKDVVPPSQRKGVFRVVEG